MKKETRQLRTRAKRRGTSKRPRLTVFRSNRYIYAQLIDDERGKTILGVSEKSIAKQDGGAHLKTDRAKKLGLILAKNAISKKIMQVIFDRGSYRYHGRVKALAEGAREGGLKF